MGAGDCGINSIRGVLVESFSGSDDVSFLSGNQRRGVEGVWFKALYKSFGIHLMRGSKRSVICSIIILFKKKHTQ